MDRLLGHSAGVRYHKALDAAKQGRLRASQRGLRHVWRELAGTKAGRVVWRRLAKVDEAVALFGAIDIDASLTKQASGQVQKKRKKIRLVLSAKKAVSRKIKLKAKGAVLMIEVAVTPGKGVKLNGWLADKSRVRRFQWPHVQLKPGHKRRRTIALALGSIGAHVMVQTLGLSKGQKAALGSTGATKSGTTHKKTVRRSRYRVVFRKATVKRIITHLAAMQGLTPRWAPGVLTGQTRRFVLETSSRALLLSVACQKLQLQCQLIGKNLQVSNAKGPTPPPTPRVPSVTGRGTPKTPTPPRR